MQVENDGPADRLNGTPCKGRCGQQDPRVSVIIPALDEEETITAAIQSASGRGIEVVVVDGGSTDRTAALAEEAGATVIQSERGRARQMNAGAAVANGEFLLFLHADTTLPSGFDEAVVRTLEPPGVSLCAFGLSIDAKGSSFRMIERLVNLRSRMFQMPYGDQALSIRSNIFREIGGFPDGPIMEDYLLVRRLRRIGRIVVTPLSVATSARRWLRHGVWRTTLANQVYIVAYKLSVPLTRIARWREGNCGVTPQTQKDASAGRVHLDAPSFCDGE